MSSRMMVAGVGVEHELLRNMAEEWFGAKHLPATDHKPRPSVVRARSV